MKTILLFLFLSCAFAFGQTPKATIHLTDGTFINNAPSGRDWTAYKVSQVTTYEITSDTTYYSNLTDQENVSYYGTWSRGKVGVGCQCSFSNVANDSIVFKFTDATYFEFRGELMAHHGIAAVYFDGNYIGEMDTYDTRNLTHTRNWKAENLDPLKVYKFKLVVTGKKNIASTGTYIVNHGFRIIKAPVVVVPPPVVVVPPVKMDVAIIRKGRFQVYVDSILLEGEHNEYEKALERAVNEKHKNPTKVVMVVSPDREVVLQ